LEAPVTTNVRPVRSGRSFAVHFFDAIARFRSSVREALDQPYDCDSLGNQASDPRARVSRVG
jgi:hypothetical protein